MATASTCTLCVVDVLPTATTTKKTSEIFQQKNVNDITGSNLFPIIGMNVFARIFGGTKNNKWEKPLAALLEEYSSIGALCAVGLRHSHYLHCLHHSHLPPLDFSNPIHVPIYCNIPISI